MKNESNKIAKLRERAGLSQPALAERTGINIRQIQKYESGEYKVDNMTLKNACILAEVFGCRAEDLLRVNAKGENMNTISKKKLTGTIRDEYAQGRKWQKLDSSNIFHMMIDLSDGEVWSDCLSSGDSRKYKSDTIMRIPWDVKYGYHVSEMEREYTENAIKLLELHGWVIDVN